MKFAIRIGRMFPAKTEGALKAFFNADIGYESDDGTFTGLFSVADFSLFAKKDGSGYFVKGFARPRMRGGEVVKGPDGYAIRDAIYSRYAEAGTDGKWTPTKAAYKFDDLLTSKAVEAYEKAAPKVPVSAGEIEGDDSVSPFGADDDDLPF